MTAIPQAEGAADHEGTSLAELGNALQLVRAGNLATARLQLALSSGDRRHAMRVMDRILDIDAEIGTLVTKLPIPSSALRDLQAVKGHLGEQKIAIAFEKLALASEVTGPDLVAAANLLPPTRQVDAYQAGDAAAIADVPDGFAPFDMIAIDPIQAELRIHRWLLALALLAASGVIAFHALAQF